MADKNDISRKTSKILEGEDIRSVLSEEDIDYYLQSKDSLKQVVLDYINDEIGVDTFWSVVSRGMKAHLKNYADQLEAPADVAYNFDEIWNLFGINSEEKENAWEDMFMAVQDELDVEGISEDGTRYLVFHP